MTMKYNQFKQFMESSVRSDSLFHRSPTWVSILLDGYVKKSRMYESEERLIADVIGREATLKYDGFVSFARTISGSAYVSGGGLGYSNSVAVLEFDRQKLAREYKIISIDYYAGGLAKRKGKGEAEDRALLKESQKNIPLEGSFIGVHILDNESQRRKKLEADLEEAKRSLEYWTVRLNRDTEADRRDAIESIVKSDAQKVERIEQEITNLGGFIEDKTIQVLMNKYPDVPFYLYSDATSWKGKRFAEAEQINPNVAGYEEDDDEV